MADESHAASRSEDRRQGHCRRLGHEVPFSYCRQAGDGLPCSRILDCWFETFDVAAFVRSAYSAERIARAFRPQSPKLTQLVNIVAAILASPRDESASEDPHEAR